MSMQLTKSFLGSAAAVAGVLSLSSVGWAWTRASMGIESAEPVKHVRAPIQGRSGSGLYGYVSMSETPNGVRIEVQVRNAEPGKHGVHFHQKADCSAADAQSAGGYFGSKNTKNGSDHLLGNLGNIMVNDDGIGALYHQVKGAKLSKKGPASLLGRGLIVHEKPDDGVKPTKKPGARIGCAEIPSKVTSS